MHRHGKIWGAVLFLCGTLGLSGSAFGGSIGLAWDASAGASGYRVYYGATSGNLTNSVDVGNTTQTTLNNLTDCSTWFFVVTAYNSLGESTPSNEVSSWTRPSVTMNPVSAMQGAQLTLTVDGASFDPGASVTVDNPNVFLDNVSRQSCTRMQAAVTIEPTAGNVRPAQIGRFKITVTNPNGTSGSKAQVFEVLVNPSRFDVNQSDPATDGRLDGLDTIWLARVFGSQEGGALYDPDLDFDGDGECDGNDLAYLASNFGRCWNGSAWSAAACPAL
ncbi:MAG TPA: hypothetical protein VJS92_04865 [Candidatus Polarisedimenticolaceae bacterium]|nr:hypothetical protein [Candidatus Polarisedimenticolaceae bacterium]